MSATPRAAPRALLVLALATGLTQCSTTEPSDPSDPSVPTTLAIVERPITVVRTATFTAHAGLRDQRDSLLAATPLTWGTRDSAIATVTGTTGTATVHGIGLGQTWLLVTAAGLTDSVRVTVDSSVTPASVALVLADSLDPWAAASYVVVVRSTDSSAISVPTTVTVSGGAATLDTAAHTVTPTLPSQAVTLHATVTAAPSVQTFVTRPVPALVATVRALDTLAAWFPGDTQRFQIRVRTVHGHTVAAPDAAITLAVPSADSARATLVVAGDSLARLAFRATGLVRTYLAVLGTTVDSSRTTVVARNGTLQEADRLVLLGVGDTVALPLVALDARGDTLPVSSWTVTIDSTAVATYANGRFVGVAAGRARATVSAPGVTARPVLLDVAAAGSWRLTLSDTVLLRDTALRVRGVNAAALTASVPAGAFTALDSAGAHYLRAPAALFAPCVAPFTTVAVQWNGGARSRTFPVQEIGYPLATPAAGAMTQWPAAAGNCDLTIPTSANGLGVIVTALGLRTMAGNGYRIQVRTPTTALATVAGRPNAAPRFAPRAVTGPMLGATFCHAGPTLTDSLYVPFNRAAVLIARPGENDSLKIFRATQGTGVALYVDSLYRAQWDTSATMVQALADLRAAIDTAVLPFYARMGFPTPQTDGTRLMVIITGTNADANSAAYCTSAPGRGIIVVPIGFLRHAGQVTLPQAVTTATHEMGHLWEGALSAPTMDQPAFVGEGFASLIEWLFARRELADPWSTEATSVPLTHIAGVTGPARACRPMEVAADLAISNRDQYEEACAMDRFLLRARIRAGLTLRQAMDELASTDVPTFRLDSLWHTLTGDTTSAQTLYAQLVAARFVDGNGSFGPEFQDPAYTRAALNATAPNSPWHPLSIATGVASILGGPDATPVLVNLRPSTGGLLLHRGWIGTPPAVGAGDPRVYFVALDN